MIGAGDTTMELIGPADAGFDQWRLTAHPMHDVRPAAIARCRSRDDVIAALAVAVERGLPVAVRGGGTSQRATVDGGIVVDLSPMDRVEVDPASSVASAGGGVTWAVFDDATQAHGLAVTGGRVSRLGVAGVALGEGSGWLERALGPTGVSIVGAEVVLADGRVVEDDPELLWALGAGGTGLGVVTRLDLRVRRVGPTLLCGLLTFSRDRVREIATAYRDYMRDAPDEVGGGLLLGAGRGGTCAIVFSHLGPVKAAEAALAPLRDLRPSMDAVAHNPYRAFQGLWDAGNPPGARAHLRQASLPDLSDECLEAVLDCADRPAAALSYVFLRPLGGALAGEAPGASWACDAVGLWPPVPALDAGQFAWVEGFADAVAPHAVDGPGGRHDEERLRPLRRRCDPSGVFAA